MFGPDVVEVERDVWALCPQQPLLLCVVLLRESGVPVLVRTVSLCLLLDEALEILMPSDPLVLSPSAAAVLTGLFFKGPAGSEAAVHRT